MYEYRVRKNLYNKLIKEFNNYKTNLNSLSTDKIISNYYEYLIKNKLYAMFHPDLDYFDFNKIKLLNKEQKPLEILYQGWMDSTLDIESDRVLRQSINETIEILSKTKNKDRVR